MENRFSEFSDNELVTAYQRECRNNGWTSSRADYLADLHIELEQRFDCSEIIEGNSLSLKTKNVCLDGKKILVGVRYDPMPPEGYEGNWF